MPRLDPPATVARVATATMTALAMAIAAPSVAAAAPPAPHVARDTGAIPLPSGGRLHATTRAGNTVFEVQDERGSRLTIEGGRDATVAAKTLPRAVVVAGEVKGEALEVLIVADAYPSIPGGLSSCQAGEERFLRVLSLGKGREVLRVKLESCRDGIELAEPGIDWQPSTSTLTLTWLRGPSASRPESLVLRPGA